MRLLIRELIKEINQKRFKAYLIGFTRGIFTSFKKTIQPKLIPFHMWMIAISIPLITLNIDWNYFIFFRSNTYLQFLLFPAVPLGTFLPFFLPPIFYLYGKLKQYRELEVLGFVLTQTAVVGLFWSALYKAFTGRHGPEFNEFEPGIANYSHEFYFGFLIGGVFDGWPSGHTTINVAIAVCFFYFRPDKRIITELEKESNWIVWILKNRKFALVYGFYIGFGISTNIHWFSDFIAGLFIGYCVGRACSEVANKIWLENQIDTQTDGELKISLLEQTESMNYDRTVLITFVILAVIIFFSIFIPREVFNL